jgi:hypothetical protein
MRKLRKLSMKQLSELKDKVKGEEQQMIIYEINKRLEDDAKKKVEIDTWVRKFRDVCRS